MPLGDEGWHLVTLDGTPGVRVVAYALNWLLRQATR